MINIGVVSSHRHKRGGLPKKTYGQTGNDGVFCLHC